MDGYILITSLVAYRMKYPHDIPMLVNCFKSIMNLQWEIIMGTDIMVLYHPHQ